MKKVILSLSIITSILSSNEYEDWLKSQNNQYNSYKKSMDDEFSDMLKKDWEAFKTMYNPSPLSEPKPKEIPQIKKVVKVKEDDIRKSPIVKTKPIIIETPKVIVADIPAIDRDMRKLNLNFYSQNITFFYDKNINFSIGKIDKDLISGFWTMISKSKSKEMLEQIEKISQNYNLNDWAKYLLINKIGEEIYSNESAANLFTWYILSKLGYDIKVGYKSDKIYLLSTIAHSVYQVAYLKLENKKYYVLSPKGRISSISSIYTYQGNYPDAKNELTFKINKNIAIDSNLKTKELKFNYLGKDYSFNATYSNDLIDFYSTFPQSDYKIYFDTKNTPEVSQSLLVGLKEQIKDKSEIEAVNFLLRFVQKSFEYKTDDDQFKFEKVMFPDETIFYKYSDCEDRSIMFASLVKSLLGLDVVGIEFPGHLATAVEFSTEISGDSFKYKGKRYTMSDPTYINANVGMRMPQYKNSKFKIVD